MQASGESIKKRLMNYGDGLWRLVKNNITVAYLYVIKLKEHFVYEQSCWTKITDNGSTLTHDSTGNVLFGVTLGSIKPGQGRILLSEAIKRIDGNAYPDCHSLFLCSRIPSLCNYFKSIDEIRDGILTPDSTYVRNDPTISIFSRLGFSPVSVVKDGYPVDSYSLGYSVLLKRAIKNH